MQTTPRGLATLALLSARFDEGRDHLGLFEPFVADAVLALAGDHFVAADLRELIAERSGLLMPADTINTLLNRFVRQSRLKREGGRFVRSTGTVDLLDRPQFEGLKRSNEAKYQALASAFHAFASEKGASLANREDALAALCSFISDNKVPLVLSEPLPSRSAQRSTLSPGLVRIVAQFITERCSQAPDLASPLEALIEGVVLQDTLMLNDLADLGHRLDGLTVFIDTPLLLSALELTGVANAVAAKEGLSLIREAGAAICAFDVTIAEMRRILYLLESRISTATGQLSIFPSDLARHLIATRKSASDIRAISATLEQRLSAIGITVKDVPKHEARYTLDETSLAESLKDYRDDDTDTPRIRHDVDCVAAVLTRRAGTTSSTLERSRAVFCTSSGLVVRNVQRWYQEQNAGGVPPIAHQFALSSIAWLKKPRSARHLKLHELVSMCASAMKPSRETWARFTEKLKQLRSDGAISDDETVAIIASDLTEPLLVAIDDDIGSDAASIDEAIDRVRAAYRKEVERDAVVAISAANTKADASEQSAREAHTDKEQLLEQIERRSARVARAVGSAFFGFMAIFLITSGVLALPGGFEPAGPTAKLVARIALALTAAYSLVGQLVGTSVSDHRDALEAKLAMLMMTRVFGLSSDVARKQRVSAQAKMSRLTSIE